MSDYKETKTVSVRYDDLHDLITFGRLLQSVLLTLGSRQAHSELVELSWRLGEQGKFSDLARANRKPRSPILDYIRSRDAMLREDDEPNS